RYDRRELGTSRLGFRIDVENYHDQWDASTQRAAIGSDTSGLYRNRLNIQPVVSFRVARDFTVSTGVSLQRLEPEFTAARAEASNAVVNTLRYRRDWEASDASQTLDAAYSLRAATRSLDSDYVYARHLVSARYDWSAGRRHVRVVSMVGSITGQAPLYDRFSLGSGTTLRGWSKYDLKPLGGSRMAYGSVEYRYRMLHAFYDTGAVWNRGASSDVKHSIGGGVHTGNLYFSAGFPLRAGRITPVFLMAMTF
ncbi:MAG: BamA/TamA family outer membrane protein, partial [Bryobacteraceae bacterium]